jgi:MYXO-CTERM domain-containing protein
MVNCKTLAAVAVLLCTMLSGAPAQFQPGDFVTYSQERWGNPASSAAALLTSKFFFVYPGGDVEVGVPGAAGFSMVFTSPSSIVEYLPASGIESPLNADLLDPSSTAAGMFGGNVLALQLDVDFADAGFLMGSANIPFGDLILVNMMNASDGSLTLNLSAFEGWTVRQLLEAESVVLGTGQVVGSFSVMVSALEFVTQSFEGGQPSQFAQNHLRIVPEPTAAGLALLALSGFTRRRRRRVLACTDGQAREPTRAGVVMMLLAGMLFPAAAARGQARYVQGYAHVAQTYNGGAIFEDQDGASDGLAGGGGSIGGAAFLLKGGTAAFSINPAAGSATASGNSASVTFSNFNHNRLGSQADGFIRIADNVTMNGVVQDDAAGKIRVNWSGALQPNTDFESEYAAKMGLKFDTASISFNMTFGWMDGGTFHGPLKLEDNIRSSEGYADFNRSFSTPFAFVNPPYNTIGIDITISGLGLMGGGYSLYGSGGVTQPSAGSGSAVLMGTSAEVSPFEIVFELPPGLSISGHSPYIRQVTIPEPSGLALLVTCALACATRRSRRGDPRVLVRRQFARRSRAVSPRPVRPCRPSADAPSSTAHGLRADSDVLVSYRRPNKRSNPMTCFMQSKHLAVVAAYVWASALAAGPATAQQPASVRIDGTFTMAFNFGQVGPDLAAIVARGETHTWTLALHGLSYSHDDEIISSDPYDYYARSITRVYATSFDFQFQGPDADALNAIVSDRLENGGLQVEPFVELRNVTYYEPGWGAIFQARDWVIAIRPLDYLQGFRFESMPADLEYLPYTEDANGYPVLEPFTSGMHGAWVQITDLRPGYAGTIGTYGGNTVSVSSVSHSLPGDYNHDGAVDGGDYVTWRKNENANVSLPNDNGLTNQADRYALWRANFGNPGSGSSMNSSAVPEPATIALLLFAAIDLCVRRGRTA